MRDSISSKSAQARKGLNYREYYDLETYLFRTVRGRFRDEGHICSFDFFSIIHWKGSFQWGNGERIADGLRNRYGNPLSEAVRELTRRIHQADDDRSQLDLLIKLPGIHLATATAILTVFYPKRFTVYDRRVTKQLGRKKITTTKPDLRWKEYQAYREAVRDTAPSGLGLRDADRYLWAKDRATDLHKWLDKQG